MAIFTADRGRIDSYKIELGEAFGRRVREARLASRLSVVRLARRRAELSPETVPAARGTSPL